MEQKKRGRPALPPEEKARRKAEQAQRRKEKGYPSRREYHQAHPEIERKSYQRKVQLYYMPKINIPREFKPTFDALLASTGKTISELVLEAVEEKYSVTLRDKKDDKTDNNTGE